MATESIEVTFPRTGHFWLDNGLLGFYALASEENPEKFNVQLSLAETGVTVAGREEDIQVFLENVYAVLLKKYYNTSSQKQEQLKEGFYYDSKRDTFVRFPKVKTMGIASLIFNKAPRPTKDVVKYDKDGNLPPEYAFLRNRLEQFLQENNLKKYGAGLLIDGPNAHQPEVTISPKKAKSKGTCYLCGNPSHALSEIKGTVFPFITGSSGVWSFNQNCGKPEKICWKCDYISKFVPVPGFYVMDDASIHMYFYHSPSFLKIQEVFSSFESMKIRDPNLYRNFNADIDIFFKKSYEQFLSFLYSVYYRLLVTKQAGYQDNDENSPDLEKMLNLTLTRAPLEFVVLQVGKLGDTYMGRMIWPFTEAVYIFRLLERLERSGINMKRVMQTLVDYEDNNNDTKTLLRNRICERILTRKSIVDLIEQHVFHVNTSKITNIKPAFDFTVEYEKILYKEADKMKQELIDTAVSLGKTIGMKLGAEGKKGKGDLFRLRKARRPEDFLNEVNRIQMKYDISVTADLYQKGEAFNQNFTEFKHFCMIAALNTYNAVLSRDEKVQIVN